VKNRKSFLLLLGLTLNVGPTPAQPQTPPQTNAQQKALEMLRQTINEVERRRAGALPTSTNAPARARPTFAEVEQQYLLGKMTARQFQRYLQEHDLEPPKTTTGTNTDALALQILRKETAKVAPAPLKSEAPKPDATRTDQAGTESEQSTLTEVEKKMDELLRLKAAREKAAQTNLPAAAGTNSTATAAPKTKRQRLDELLKLYIESKIPEAEYSEKRSKIIAEPD
jgi:hypothetical protein